MKKVLFVATVTKHINTFHIPYLKWFKEQGYEVHVASNGEEKIEYCDKHFNLPFERFPLKIKNIKVYNELKKIINDNEYEIIHCHTPVGGVLARLAARKARKKYNTKVIYTAHGFHFYKGAPILNWVIYYPIERWLAKYTDCLITINTEDYEFAKKKFKKARSIEHINGVGFNTERFNIEILKEEKEEIKKDFNIEKDEVVLSYVAELNKNKNQGLLIDVVEQLMKDNLKVKLLLIGEGPLKEYYEKVIKEKQLQKNVLVLGKRQDVPQLLSITDIYVASSIREGLPVNIMEAMYMGLPIVATDNRGHRELIVNNDNGFIVSNSKELKLNIELLIENKELREKMKNVSIEKTKDYYIENVIKQVESIYINIKE